MQGLTTPRLQTPRLSGKSLVDDFAAFAELLGEPLLPWQKYALDHGLSLNPDGDFSHRRVGILVSRQNGKSHLMRVRLLAGMFLLGEKWVSMAQKLELMEEFMDKVISDIEGIPFLAAEVEKISRTNGKRYITLKNGGRWSIKAGTSKGARGFTGNLWIDEVREIDEATYSAAEPVTRAVKNPQIWLTSNAGDDFSTVLNRIRANALQPKQAKFAWLEWSGFPEKSKWDKDSWRQANPALGYLISPEELELSCQTATDEDFKTESLCLWVDALTPAFPTQALNAAMNPKLQMADDAQTFLAIDVSPDRKRADLVGAQKLDGDKIAFSIMETWEASDSLDNLKVAGEIAAWARQYPTPLIAFDKYNGAEIAARLSSAGFKTVDTSGAPFMQGCDEMLSALVAERVEFDDNPDILQHFLACARKTSPSGGWRVIKANRQAPISAACAAIMALHHASKPQRESQILFG